MDLGKRKFGGPFIEEEVEDVKTIIRLIPLLICVGGIGCFPFEINDQFGLHVIAATKLTFECVSDLKQICYNTAAFILIPVYHFMVYPFIGKYVPSMLKLMGAGVFLCFISTVVVLTIDSIGHFHSNASQCIFDDNTATGTIPVPIYWVLVIEALNGVGIVLVTCSLFEFVMAQTPNRMRGIMMGLIFTILGFQWLGSFVLNVIFHQFSSATPSCVFYYYLVLSLLMLLTLVAYVILAKRYKLRERERHINIQAIAEDHYVRYFDQEEEYMREMANSN